MGTCVKKMRSLKCKFHAASTTDGVFASRIEGARRERCDSGQRAGAFRRDLSALTKKLKQACGSGGTVKEGVIEIQGEQREKIADILRKLDCKVKVAGG